MQVLVGVTSTLTTMRKKKIHVQGYPGFCMAGLPGGRRDGRRWAWELAGAGTKSAFYDCALKVNIGRLDGRGA